ncbi:hypothetical protein L596_020867 [Steinernema carpocapsae]|uniref:G-protein coupled receptors family 1 profile domain-containing protein n=1 Tax=Steinernema carpocapsae TaxID=34508 RepID=A0A4U5MUT4_STECR|nr:hypothetical protein L596_020867 [Steinernema carpocapsae]
MAASQLHLGSMVLQSINRIVSYVLPIPHTIVNLVVIWLTFKKIKPSLSRTFTFNLMIPSFGYGLYLGAVDILGFLDLDQHFGFRSSESVIFLDYVTDFVLYYCTYSYRTLAILIVAITYISFTKPSIYQKLNRKREMTVLFLGCHMIAFLCSLSATTAPNRAVSKYLSEHTFEFEAAHITILEVFTGCVDFFTFVVLVTLYLASIYAILHFKRSNSTVGSSDRVKQKRIQNQLYATLVFITPPSLFLIPNSICINIMFAVVTQPFPVLDELCQAKIELFETLLMMRLFLASSMLLVAFADYRRALLECVCKNSIKIFTTSKKTTPLAYVSY